jgi:hypothetical protein
MGFIRNPCSRIAGLYGQCATLGDIAYIGHMWRFIRCLAYPHSDVEGCAQHQIATDQDEDKPVTLH